LGKIRCKFYKDIKEKDEKLKKQDKKALELIIKHLKMTEQRLAKGEALNELQADAMTFLVDKDIIKESELPIEYHQVMDKVMYYGAGVCSKYRKQSGCLVCDQFKYTRYWMKREYKRTGRYPLVN
jgi:hypothetical protein